MCLIVLGIDFWQDRFSSAGVLTYCFFGNINHLLEIPVAEQCNNRRDIRNKLFELVTLYTTKLRTSWL